MKQFEIVEAIFSPKRLDDLVPGAKNLIGRKFRWQCVFKIEGGEFDGQWAMMLLDQLGYQSPFVWVPECDLEVIE